MTLCQAGRVGDQDLLQVIDDQQQRPLPALPRLGARPGQQVHQHHLDRLGPLPDLRQPGLDQLPGRRVGPDRLRHRVGDRQRPVVPEHHRHRVVREPVGDPGGQAGLAQPTLPVQQHPRPLAGPQHAQRLLQLRPPPHEHLRRRHRHLPLTIQERLSPMGGRDQGPFPSARDQRAAAAQAQPQPGQMPVPAHHRVGRFEQYPAGIPHRHRQIRLVRQPLVQPTGKRGGRPVIHRPVPPQHRREPRRHQSRGQRMRHQPAPAATGLALAAIPWRWVTGSIRAGGGQARRHEQQPRHPGQQAGKIPSRSRPTLTDVVLHHQHRHARASRPDRPVIQPMTRQVHHRHLARSRRPASQLLRVASVLNQQVQPSLADRGQDRCFLGLEVQLMLAARRGRHERQPQPEPIQPRPLHARPQAPRHAEPGQLILSQEPPTGLGQQLKRRPQHRPPRLGRRLRAGHLEHQRAGRPLQQRTKLPLLTIQPAVQVPAQLDEHALISAGLYRTRIPASQPGQELHISRPDHPA